MAYRPVRIEVTRCGLLLGYSARVIRQDDGLPGRECPVHGWDGPPRDGFGTMLHEGRPWTMAPREALAGCVCPVQTGFDLEQSGYGGVTHRRAFRNALKGVGGRLYTELER